MNFELTSAEGLSIRGNFDVPKNARALVLVVHGFKGFKDWGFFPWLAEHLCGHRFVICRFNMSRSGIGENPETFDRLDLFAEDTYSCQIADLRQVAQYARSRFSGLPIFLLGHSRGGGVALLAAKGVSGLKGVVTWSSIARADRWTDSEKKEWREKGSMDVVNARTGQVMKVSTAILDDCEAQQHDILGATAALGVPLLVLHGGKDDSVQPFESEEIAAQVTDVSHLVLGNATHTWNASHPLLTLPVELTMAAEISARFIGAYC
jgi:dienelactone hydrolase